MTNIVTHHAINRAIKHTGLRVRAARAGHRYLGYAYFVDGADNQVGESVMVPRLSDLTLERWVAEAERALEIDPKI